MSMEQSHAEEERLLDHILFKHNMPFKEYYVKIRIDNTWDAVDDLNKFHNELHKKTEKGMMKNDNKNKK